MPVYRYQGRDKVGKSKSGRISAESRKEAVTKLRQTGLAVTSIEELKSILYKEISLGTGKTVKNRDFIIYLRQFATLLKAGVSLVEATKTLIEQTSSKQLKATLTQVLQTLEEGRPYSEGAEKYRRVFPPLFVNMLRAGEAGGNMDEVLNRLANYYEKNYETRQKVKSAMAYPVTVGIITVLIVIFMLTFIVPTFADMFASFGGKLPWITRMVMNLGGSFRTLWWLFPLLVIGIYAGIRLIRINQKVKYYLDFAVLKMPVFGKLLQKSELARLTRTLSSLFASSVPILQALTIVERVLSNQVYKKVLKASRTAIESGQSMAVPMEKHWAFPPLVTQMIAIGEKSGTLDLMLGKVADFYEMEVDNATEQIKSLLEPIMIVFLAGAVGIVVLAIAVPMFSIFKTIQQ